MTAAISRRLRKSQTPAERRLWQLLRNKQLANYKFRRQFVIGRYIADFACFQHKLIIEADGSQHADSKEDKTRTADLEKSGWHVLRFWNNDILQNPQSVLHTILTELEKP